MPNYTPEQQQWLKQRDAFRAGKTYLCHGFKNTAILTDGSMAVGMSKNMTWGHYTAYQVLKDGEHVAYGWQWDLEGRAMGDYPNLNLKTVQSGVYTV